MTARGAAMHRLNVMLVEAGERAQLIAIHVPRMAGMGWSLPPVRQKRPSAALSHVWHARKPVVDD
jgi:hypothetical protein